MSSPAVWYEANAVCGDDLVRLGVVLLVCMAVFVVGSTRAIVQGIRVVKRSQVESRTPVAFNGMEVVPDRRIPCR